MVRDDEERVRQSQRARGEDESLVRRLLDADERRRALLAEFGEARAEQKRLGAQVARASAAERESLLERSRSLASIVKRLSAESAHAEDGVNRLLRQIPNVTLDDVPSGGPDGFRILDQVRAPRDFAADGFEPRDHLDLARRLGVLDMERGAKVAGSRFFYLRGAGALLERALMGLCQDIAAGAGCIPLSVPNLVLEGVMRGSGFLDAHAEDIYRLDVDGLYLTGTSEVSLIGYHAKEIIDLSNGPLSYTATSTCYRREAGSHGQDTRGIFRTHQFQKTEMVTFCRQEDANREHERILNVERRILDALSLPYRIIDVAAGDLGSSAARKYDCEAWIPSQQRYRELTSASNCTTYQSIRLGIRERKPSGSGTRPVATLNGTMATTRWLVAILENHQQSDGSILLPEALAERLGTAALRPE